MSWLALSLADAHALMTAPGAAFEMELALAAALHAEGLVKGDRVAIAMRNQPEWPATFFAALMPGAIAMPLNAWWTGAEREYVYCIEVADALCSHPAVMDAGVIGLPHRTLDEESAALVTLKPGQQASEDELRIFVRARLAAYKVPVHIVRLREPLPRNANGKIVKKELGSMFSVTEDHRGQ